MAARRFPIDTRGYDVSLHNSREGDLVLKKTMDAVKKDLWVVVLDIVAVNVSYYLALLIRFFVGGELRAVAVERYMPAWMSFTPIYSVLAILVFMLFRLYGGMWRYAGINDMNRIILANVCTTVLHVLGTSIFFTRMPWTYYAIGGVLQFFLVVLIRFAYRLFLVEKTKLKKTEKVAALVVGSGDLGRKVVRHLEENTPYRAVAIIGQGGISMDGIPVVGFDDLDGQIEKVRAVFIADKNLSAEDRAKVKASAGDREITDFTGALANNSGFLPVSTLLSLSSGPVVLVLDGIEKKYGSGREALESLKDRYTVKSISGARIELEAAKDWTAGFAQDYKAVTGEDVSFF